MTVLTRRTAILLTGSALFLPAGAARAHHGWGNYRADEPLELSGVIEAISFDWPHAEMLLRSEGRLWAVVLAPPSRTRSRGLTEEVATVGVEARVMGYAHRSHPDEIRVEWVAVAGTTYRMR